MDKELEEAKEYLIKVKESQSAKVAEGYIGHKDIVKAIETVLNYIENSIPKKKVEDKIEKLNDIKSEYSQRVIYSKTGTYTELAQEILQELLEDK